MKGGTLTMTAAKRSQVYKRLGKGLAGRNDIDIEIAYLATRDGMVKFLHCRSSHTSWTHRWLSFTSKLFREAGRNSKAARTNFSLPSNLRWSQKQRWKTSLL